MAEREGFEPSIEFPLYTLSKRAPSTTRPSLRGLVRAGEGPAHFSLTCSTHYTAWRFVRERSSLARARARSSAASRDSATTRASAAPGDTLSALLCHFSPSL